MSLKFHPKIHSDMINLCLNGGTMENCKEFEDISSLLNTANDFVKNFSKIRFKGGNEPYIQEISVRLGSYLKRAGFAQDLNGKVSVTDIEVTRKIVWYLMLNTEYKYTHSLEDDPNIIHCLNKLPQLTPCLLLETLWNTSLDQFLYEIVSYTPAWFITSWFDDILESLRTMEPFVLLERVQLLLNAVLIQLQTLCSSSGDQQKYLEKISDFIAALLCHFNSPPGQLEEWAKVKKSKYYGFAMFYLLSVTHRSMLMYGGQENQGNDKILTQFYHIMSDTKHVPVKIEPKSETSDDENVYREICNMFLNTLENLTMLIDANTFIDWFDFDFPDPKHLDDDYTLQHLISNLTHDLLKLQWDRVSLKHDVFQKLQSIQIPRKSTEEFAKELILGTLMQKLDNHKILSEEDAVTLLDEFLSRGMIYNNEECLDTLDNCKTLIREKQCEKIIQVVGEEDDVEESCQEKLGKVLSGVIDGMNEKDLVNFLLRHDTYFTKPYVNVEFNCDLEDVLYDPSIETVQVLRAVAKTPEKLFLILPDIISNTQKFNTEVLKQIIDHYLKVLVALLPVLSNISPNFIKTLKNLLKLSLPDTSSLVHFFTKLYKTLILPRPTFMKALIIKNIAQVGDGTEQSTLLLNVSHILMKILDQDSVGLTEYLPTLLIAYGLLLENLRGTIEKCGERASSLMEAVTTTLHKLVKVFLPIATKDQKLFIQQQLKDIQPLTKFYFVKFEIEKGDTPPTLEHFLHPTGFASLPKRLITATFCEYLTKCTRKELTLISKNHQYRHYFTDAMLIIVMSLKNQPFTLEFALKNYSFLFQMMVNEEIPAVQELLALFKGVINIFCALPENQKDVFAYGILAHLKKLIGNILEKDDTLKRTVEEELVKTHVVILSPEIIIAEK